MWVSVRQRNIDTYATHLLCFRWHTALVLRCSHRRRAVAFEECRAHTRRSNTVSHCAFGPRTVVHMALSAALAVNVSVFGGIFLTLLFVAENFSSHFLGPHWVFAFAHRHTTRNVLPPFQPRQSVCTALPRNLRVASRTSELHDDDQLVLLGPEAFSLHWNQGSISEGSLLS